MSDGIARDWIAEMLAQAPPLSTSQRDLIAECFATPLEGQHETTEE